MGMFGEAMYAGANDNASGVAILLELARYFKKNQPHYSIQFIFFAAEEAGFYGSEYYVANPVYPLDKTKLVINFDMVATGTKWTELIHAELYPDIKKQFISINNTQGYIKHLKPTGYEDTSDHYHFHDAGIPALFFWTAGGNEYYHEPLDTAEKLEYPVFEGIYQLVVDYIEAN
jgi:Zn-dependent M28 family amino/carboxypeptidase